MKTLSPTEPQKTAIFGQNSFLWNQLYCPNKKLHESCAFRNTSLTFNLRCLRQAYDAFCCAGCISRIVTLLPDFCNQLESIHVEHLHRVNTIEIHPLTYQISDACGMPVNLLRWMYFEECKSNPPSRIMQSARIYLC